MELTVLGAGPAYTDRPGSTGAAYLIRHGDAAILLDLGQGSFPALAGALEPSGLLGILVSHLHADHFIDLIPLRHYLRYEFRPPRRLKVLGPLGLAERIDALHDEPGFTDATLDVARVPDGPAPKETSVSRVSPGRMSGTRSDARPQSPEYTSPGPSSGKATRKA